MEQAGNIVDRDDECGSLLTAIRDGYRMIVINGAPESGFSSFCKKAAYLLASNPNDKDRFDVLLLELDGNMIDFATALVDATVVSSGNLEKRLAKDMANLHKGAKPGTSDIVGSVLQSVISASAGALCTALNVDALGLSAFAAVGSATCYSGLFSRIYAACTSSAYAGELNPDRAFTKDFLRGIGKGTVILIDGAQSLTDRSLDDLMDAIAENSYLVLILGLTGKDNKKASKKALVKCGDRCAQTCYPSPVDFRFPDFDLLNLLNEVTESPKSDEELAVILAKYRENIWDLVYALRAPSAINFSLGGEARRVLETCMAFGDPVARETLEAFLLSEMEASTIAEQLQWLEALGFLKASNADVLSLTEIGQGASCMPEADLLFRRNEILSFFECYDGNIDYRSLKCLISVAQKVYPTSLQPVKHLVRRYVAEQLSRGLPVSSPSFLDVAFPSTMVSAMGEAAIDDLLIKIASLFVLQDFTGVVNTVEEAGDIALSHEEVRLYYAIALNRIRDHERADGYLEELFDDGSTCDVRAIAACYYIPNLLYLNQPLAAREAYKKVGALSESVFYPYVLRNCASIKDSGELVGHLQNVLSMERIDPFCKATVRNNLGRAYLAAGKLDQAEESFAQAISELADYHYRNEAIVANNMAILRCKQGLPEEALALAMHAKMMAEGEMPSNEMQQLFINITLSAAMFKSEDPRYESFINEVERRVLAHHVRHTKEVYYANRALFEVLSESPNAGAYIQQLSEHCNVLRPGRTEEVVAILRDQLERKTLDSEELWDRCFDPPYLVFWYVNPTLISERVITDYLGIAGKGFREVSTR